MCDCSKKEKPHLTDEQVVEGRKIIRDTLIAFTVGQKEEFERIFSDDNPRYPAPSVVQYGKIAYCAKPADKGNHTKRTRTSLGRYLNRQENLKIGTYLENACNAAMAAIAHFYPLDAQFEILRGEDLKMAYKTNVGGGSCMSGTDGYRQSQLDFYAQNPEQVGLLVWGKKRGRALIWTLPGGGYYIDRLYSGDGNASQAYAAWAKENKVKYSFEGFEGTKSISSNPVDIEMEWQGGETPYFDTLDHVKGKIYTLGGRKVCDRCGENCHGDSFYIHSSDETVCGGCFDSYYACCNDCGENFLFEDGREIADGGYVCCGCSESYTECEVCCILYRDRDVHEVGDGAILCEGCLSMEGWEFCPECNKYSQDEFGVPKGSKTLVCAGCCEQKECVA